MKFASLLLSAILIVLSCLPCADSGGEDVIGSRANSIAGKHNGCSAKNAGSFGKYASSPGEYAGYHKKGTDHSGHGHNDLCSPFCICNCCGVQILSFAPSLSFSIHEAAAAFISKPKIIHTSHFASMFSGSIWQPPQIV